MEQTLTVILGLPGAGKSTYTKNRRLQVNQPEILINIDTIRAMYGTPYAPALEGVVWDMVIHLANSALGVGHSVIIDESITQILHMARILGLAHMYDLKIHAVEVQSDGYLCWKKREGTNFPREGFERKFKEWATNREQILNMCHTHEIIKGNTELFKSL